MISSGNVSLDKVEYIDSTHVKISLKNWKTYYEDLTLTVNIPADAYSDSNGAVALTTDVTCLRVDSIPQGIELGNDAVTLNESNAYRLKGSLTSNVQQGNSVDYFLNVAEAGDYTLTYNIYNNGAVTNAIKLSKGNGTLVDGNITTYNLANFWGGTNSIKDTISLSAGQQTLRIEALDTGFELKSITIEKKSGPKLINGDVGAKTTVKADEFYQAAKDKGYSIETKSGIKDIGSTVAGSGWTILLRWRLQETTK